MATVYRSEPGELDGGGGSPDSGASGTVDPASIDASGATAPDAEPRKRRGRPPGSGGARRTSKKGEKVALDLSAMTGMFVGLHALLADRTNVPQIAITEDEGARFMGAAQNVMRHYSVETTQKTLDWIAFAGVGAGIYMPRLAAIGIERRNRMSAQPRQTAPQASRPISPTGPEAAPTPHIVVDNVSTFEDGHNG